MEKAFPVKIQVSTRVYWGDLYIEDRALSFVTLKDESAIKANAGQATARQFGLIGMLIYGIFKKSEKKIQAELEEKRQELAQYPLAERIDKSSMGFRLEPEQIEKANATFWGGRYIKVGNTKYIFQEIQKPDLQEIGSWCLRNRVPQKGMVKE